MPAKSLPPQPFDSSAALLNTYAINCRISEYMIRGLDAAAWNAPTPDRKGRNIASIAVHIHNVRLMWLKAIGAKGAMPAKLDGETVSPAEAIVALNESGPR